jgi:glycosyltransferase involved in cell wall biosynthesis
MGTSPEVGIVVANYNNAAYVTDAVTSVASQTIRNVRVIVVDDNSKDGSDETIRAVLSELDDRRFRYLKLDHNKGQAGAIRSGLALLDTPFVSFLDSDDYWYEDFVRRHLAAHLNSDFPVALTYCDSHIVNADAQLLAGTAWWFENDPEEPAARRIPAQFVPEIEPKSGRAEFAAGGDLILHTRWSPAWASNSMAGLMFRRAFVDLVLTPPDEELRLYVDFYLSTFAALLTGTIAIPEALYAYRMHGDNMHSNGMVFGGAYNPSEKPWQPIRDGILKQVLGVLQHQADPLRRAFGPQRHEQAMTLMRTALGDNDMDRGAKRRNRPLFRRSGS